MKSLNKFTFSLDCHYVNVYRPWVITGVHRKSCRYLCVRAAGSRKLGKKSTSFEKKQAIWSALVLTRALPPYLRHPRFFPERVLHLNGIIIQDWAVETTAYRFTDHVSLVHTSSCYTKRKSVLHQCLSFIMGTRYSFFEGLCSDKSYEKTAYGSSCT